MQFLSGDTEPIQRELERRMREAAEEERFEEAARYRNRLFSIQHLAERQAADRRDVGDVDVLGLALDGDRGVVQIFPLRGGKMIDRYSFHLENVEEQDVTAVLESFCVEYYGATPSVPPQIVVPQEAGDLSALEQFLSERRGSRVEVRRALRGEKRRLAELAAENAQQALTSAKEATATRRARRAEALEELREALNLESLPLRIECYDISTIQGSRRSARWSCSRTRRRRRRTTASSPCARSTGRTTSRRWPRSSRAASRGSAGATRTEYDESFVATPNLVVIDGGKGQLSAALAAMQEFDLPRVAVIALAKRVEEVFVPGRPDPIVLDPHSPGLQLLQRIRDEAHRFALGFHRQRRDARSFETIFDTLQGVGPARRRAILRHFGSPERFLEASQEELEGVPELPAATARKIYAQLHKAGRG